MATQPFKRLIRFIPQSSPHRILLGQPVDPTLDIGLAAYHNKAISVDIFSGTTILSPGHSTGTTDVVKTLLSPLTASEVGSIRCIGLNYRQHAAEVNMALPTVPVLFMKPSTALAGPWPEVIKLPKITQVDQCGDYEAELAVVIGTKAKDVREEDAMGYVLGYTASNDVSSRTSQFAQSQWCFSKGFDGSCPIGPTLVAPELLPNLAKARIRGLRNDEVVQDCALDDLVFTVPKLVSFLSQGTTLLPGTIILTGTPAGVGVSRKPPVSLVDGDVFAVEISPHIGTLVNKFENE